MYEITLRGYDGSTDDTDHLVLWAKSALDADALKREMANFGLLVENGLVTEVVPLPPEFAIEARIDFELPRQLAELKARAEFLCALETFHANNGVSISDDDLCATCAHCVYLPGEISQCKLDWPGLRDRDQYVQVCRRYQPVG